MFNTGNGVPKALHSRNQESPADLVRDRGFVIEWLVELANGDPESDATSEALRWIHRLARYGITENLLRDLEKEVQDVKVPATLTVDSGSNTFIWEFDKPPRPPSYKTATAFIVACLIANGTIHKVRQCQLKECGKYFVGKTNAKWCSKTCGSKVRVRAKRRRDGQSEGAYESRYL